ncbi:MAG: hypothetical protein H8E40_10060 [Chloroflexi bacterium]|nr:hypothetical protein [Chloroflexota bacterium]
MMLIAFLRQHRDAIQLIDAIIGITTFVIGLLLNPKLSTVFANLLERHLPHWKKVFESIVRRWQNYRGWFWRIAALCLIVYGISLLVPPLFRITDPRDGQCMASTLREISVEGEGAQPGEFVRVYVFDQHEEHLQRNFGPVSQNGTWVVDSVVLQTLNYPYDIRAETTIDNAPVRAVNHPTVIRRTRCLPSPLLIGLLMLIIVVVASLLYIDRSLRRGLANG